MDIRTDSSACGADCKDCDQYDPGSRCCGGTCVRGCEPDTFGSYCAFGPCEQDCQICPSGEMCCNRGPGTPGQCVASATFCPRPAA